MTRNSTTTSDHPLVDAIDAPPSSSHDLADTCSYSDNGLERYSNRLLQSRVGRDQQRYDGNTRLLVCIAVVSRRPRNVGTDTDECLLISSSKHPTQWILPKGGWETDESVAESALREANEEAGVAGHIVDSLGTLDFASQQGKPCRFYGFKLQVTEIFDDWAENTRLRKWARELLQRRPELLEMVSRAAATT
uniref:Nudix hydrolase domain-containing protein n=1 Tax=Hyaloperonospora arabidopsidis (strain Emoy2) TaxID=559515 RepID=M4C2R0_HYAAE